MGGQFPKILRCPHCEKTMHTSFKIKVQCPYCKYSFFYWEAKEYYIKTNSFRIEIKEKKGKFKIKLQLLKRKNCPTT